MKEAIQWYESVIEEHLEALREQRRDILADEHGGLYMDDEEQAELTHDINEQIAHYEAALTHGRKLVAQ